VRATECWAVWQHFTGMLLCILHISFEDKSCTTTEAFIGDVKKKRNADREYLCVIFHCTY
jgi:hypothetical protein